LIVQEICCEDDLEILRGILPSRRERGTNGKKKKFCFMSNVESEQVSSADN
jgi:hypothetical protein